MWHRQGKETHGTETALCKRSRAEPGPLRSCMSNELIVPTLKKLQYIMIIQKQSPGVVYLKYHFDIIRYIMNDCMAHTASQARGMY